MAKKVFYLNSLSLLGISVLGLFFLLCINLYISSLSGETAVTNERTPASVITLEDRDQKVTSQGRFENMVTLQLDCLNKNNLHKTINSYAKFMRLTGAICQSEHELIETEITNLSNDFKATIFYFKNNKFSSDYIQLEPGINKLLISHKLTDGKKYISEIIVKKDKNIVKK